MKTRITIFAATLGLLIMSTGCYTKLYRPGMEDNGPFSMGSLYNRYDSTAIDTTLTKPETVTVYPNNDPYYYDNWSAWGRPRGYTRWGFDFDRFSPNYYNSYYGYYDYYGRPWWQDWNHNHGGRWWGGSPGAPGEPPSQRPGRRSTNTGVPPATIGNNYGQGGATTVQPIPTTPGNPSEPGNVKNPVPAPPAKVPPAPTEDNSQKRNGKRRR